MRDWTTSGNDSNALQGILGDSGECFCYNLSSSLVLFIMLIAVQTLIVVIPFLVVILPSQDEIFPSSFPETFY